MEQRIATTNIVPPPPSAAQMMRAKKVCHTERVGKSIRVEDYDSDFRETSQVSLYTKFIAAGEKLKVKMETLKLAAVNDSYEKPVDQVSNSVHRLFNKIMMAGFAFNPRRDRFCTEEPFFIRERPTMA